MKKYAILIMLSVFLLTAETLFQVKDSSDRVVLDVSTDGLRVYNEGDLLMVISASEIKAFIEKDTNKALSRSFAVTTASSKGVTDVLEVTTSNTKMSEGDFGERYSDISSKNVFLGLKAGHNTVPWTMEPTFYGTRNTFLGNYAGFSNTSGFGNVYIGYEAGYMNTGSNQNIYIGYNAGYSSPGQSNTIVGYNAGKGTVGGSGGDYNTFYGRGSGFNFGTGADNTFLGGSAGSSLVNGSGNTFVGKDSGSTFASNANYNNNTFLGKSTGTQLTSGNNNVLLGFGSGAGLQSASGNVFLGYQAGASETASNKLYIANSNTATPLIKGTFPNTDLDLTATNIRLNGNINNHLRIVYPETAADGITGTFIDIQNSDGNLNGRMSGIRFQTHSLADRGPKGAIFFSRSTDWGRGDMHFAVNNAGDGSQVTVSDALMSIERNGDVKVHNRLRVGGNTDGTAWTVGVTGQSLFRGLLSTTGSVRHESVYGYAVGSTNRALRIDDSGYIGGLVSSRKYKENISDMEDINWLYSLRPVNFNYITDSSKKKVYGLIAEEVEKVNSFFASYNSDGEVETVNYEDLITPMLKAIQDQQKLILELQREIEKLKK